MRKRFSSRNTLFNRFQWDKTLPFRKSGKVFVDLIGNHSYKGKKESGNGFDQKDKALHNSGWDAFNRLAFNYSPTDGLIPGATSLLRLKSKKQKNKLDETPQELSRIISRASKLYRCKQIGFTKTNLDWHYSDQMTKDGNVHPPEDLSGLDNCIVLIIPQDYDTVKTFPSTTAGAGQGYFDSISIGYLLASFIRNLGYEAVVSINDTAQSIPYAIEAGLGKYGRSGLFLSSVYGPRVRIAKIFTDAPVAYTTPDTIEWNEPLCHTCNKCATACPPKAIPFGEPNKQIHSISNNDDVDKWIVNAEACFSLWNKTKNECGICMRVCPFNKDLTKRWHRVYNRIIFKPLLEFKMYKTLLWFEKAFRFDKRKNPRDWWNDN